ncbi:MAG TPA: riboflavin synthase [Lachnospiraceae bacterium]|nr:riboflavin synthase [Lachnospiraceae bacterium]
MFTGIIEETGTVSSIAEGSMSAVITIQASKVLEQTRIGDSIAVNGVCLTVTSIHGKMFSADIMAETLRRSSLGSLSKGSPVNLERAMLAGGRFGGHIVSGHIDGTGTVVSMRREDNAVWVTISTGQEILKYIVKKGSIAIDGISLTVAELSEDTFAVSVIPHTSSETTLLKKCAGDIVNLENDIIGKYVERLLSFKDNRENQNYGRTDNGSARLTMDFLVKNGF